MLGTDVSDLTTTAADAASQGLSIVIPVYNEGAGLTALHERLNNLARTLRQLPERNRFFKGLASWIGFRQIRVDYEPAAR
ncbi:MAG: hypothetical protein E6501_32150, partial [Bradyrhizobium sp.]|nr:hypothetical protein [Bradyrhizobium sp.]